MKLCLSIPVLALAISGTASAEPAAGLAPGALAPTAEAAPPPREAPPPAVDPVRRAGGITIVVLSSLGMAGGIAQMIAGKVMTRTESCDEEGFCLPDIRDASSLVISGGITLGVTASALPFGILLLASDVWADEKPTVAAGEPFEIDQRPRAIAPRHWLGEF